MTSVSFPLSCWRFYETLQSPSCLQRPDASDILEDEQETLIALAEQSSADVFTRSFQAMLNVHEQVARSPRPKLALEMAVARLVSIRAAVPIDAMLDKITRLEAGSRQMNRRQQAQQRGQGVALTMER